MKNPLKALIKFMHNKGVERYNAIHGYTESGTGKSLGLGVGGLTGAIGGGFGERLAIKMIRRRDAKLLKKEQELKGGR
jgi:hypothetical protein